MNTTGGSYLTTSAPSPSTTIPGGVSLLGDQPVLAVKIDNTSGARPRVGLDAADIVYVEPVEAGLTRLLAVFASKMPPEVGPIRSARESDATILGNYGRVAFAYSGASSISAAAIAKGPQVNVSMDSGGVGYRRERSRKAPYNVMGDTAALLTRAGGSSPAGDIGFHVGSADPSARAATTVSTAYSLARFLFTWDGARGRYVVSTDGRPEVTPAGAPITTATILVQMVRTRPSANRDVNGIATPVIEVVGTGAVRLLRGGQVTEGTWSRPTAADPTRLTGPSGAELTMAPGPLWVLLVPEGQSVTVG